MRMMKKQKSYRLLVDISGVLESMKWIGSYYLEDLKEDQDKFEIWTYTYDEASRVYRPFGLEEDDFRGSMERRRVYLYAATANEEKEFYPTAEQAILHQAIQGKELYVADKMRAFPISPSFSDIKKTWRKVS